MSITYPGVTEFIPSCRHTVSVVDISDRYLRVYSARYHLILQVFMSRTYCTTEAELQGGSEIINGVNNWQGTLCPCDRRYLCRRCLGGYSSADNSRGRDTKDTIAEIDKLSTLEVQLISAELYNASSKQKEVGLMLYQSGVMALATFAQYIKHTQSQIESYSSIITTGLLLGG